MAAVRSDTGSTDKETGGGSGVADAIGEEGEEPLDGVETIVQVEMVRD